MHKYSGKSKCFCGKRAKYRVLGSHSLDNKFACEAHKHIIENIPEETQVEDDYFTEADYQTWRRL